MGTKTKKRGPKTKFDNCFYVRVYELRKAGVRSRAQVAKALGVYTTTLATWLENDEALVDAWEKGTLAGHNVKDFSFKDYVHGRLPPNLQKTWEDIEGCGDDAESTIRLAELLGRHGKLGQQRLYLFALVESGFTATNAMKKCGLDASTVRNWINNDPAFGELLQEIDEAKKDFFEGGLIELVRRRDVSATLLANRTLNADRGYGDKKQLEIKGTVQHQHTLDISKLGLDLDVRKKLLEAMRRYNEEHNLPSNGTVVTGQLIAPPTLLEEA